MAFVIPIFQPHYKYANHIIESLKNFHVYFVFTHVKDFDEFPHKNVRHIILEKYLQPHQILTINKKRIHPSFKKLFALYLLHKQYDYICCLDAEIHVIKPPNLKEVYEDKKIIGGILQPFMTGESRILNFTIFGHCHNENDKQKLKELSNHGTFYTWWSTMPVYKCENVPKFLDYIGFYKLDRFLELENNAFFENMCYNYYCLLYEGFKMIIVPTLCHSLEFSHHGIVKEQSKHHKLGWVNMNAYLENPNYYKNNKYIYIVYHLDRKQFPQYLREEIRPTFFLEKIFKRFM